MSFEFKYIPDEYVSPKQWTTNNVFKSTYFDNPLTEGLQELFKDNLTFIFKQPEYTTSTQSSPKNIFSKYKTSDKDNFVKYLNMYGDPEFNDWFTKIAALESAFRQNPSENKNHSGWFQIADRYLAHYTNNPDMTRSRFEASPQDQFKAAKNLAKENLTQIRRDKYIQAWAKKHGYSDWDLLAGAWLVGFGGLKDYIIKGIDSKDGNGTSVSSRINNYKNMVI